MIFSAKRIVICFFVMSFTSYLAFAQVEKPVFDSDGALIMPKWMDDIMNNSDGVDYNKTINKYSEYIKQLPNNGKKTPYNKTVINAFKWWMRTYSPFVDDKGIIRFPNGKDMSAMIDKMNSVASYKNNLRTLSVDEQWSVISPFVTYDADTKKKAVWQSNVSRIDASNSHPDIVYAGTDTGMVFKTKDKGLNWTACDPMTFFGGEITTLEVSNTNPNKVIVGSVMNGFFLTEDGGNSWRNITPLKNVGKALHRIRDAVFDPQNDNHIIVGTDEGIWDSKNNGATWTKKMSGMCFDIKYQIKNNATPQIYILKDDNVFMGGGGNVKLYISSDNGVNYQKKDLPVANVSSGRIAVSHSNPDYLYMLVCTNAFPDKFYYRGRPYILKSTDAGNTIIANDVYGQVDSMDKPGGQGYYDMVINVSPTNPEHILFGLLFLYSSKDGGRTLDLYPQRYPSNTGEMKTNIGGYYGTYDLHTDMQDLDVAPNGTTWLSTDGGIIYSPDFMASEPEVRHDGVYASELFGFDQGWNQDIIVGGRNHNGNMCQDLDNYEGKTIALKGSEHPTGYIFLSNERKITFQDNKKRLIMPDKWNGEYKDFENYEQFKVWPCESARFGNTFEFHPYYAKCFLMVTSSEFTTERFSDKKRNQLWITYDDGLSYELIHTFDKYITSYAISRSNPNKIVVSTIGAVFYTLNGGQDWVKYNTPEQLKEYPTFRVAIHPTDENEVWINTYDNGDGVFVTKNNGETWFTANEGLDDIDRQTVGKNGFFITHFFLTGNEKDAVYAIAENKYKYDYLYHRYDNKIVYRDNELNRWVNISQGLRPGARISRFKPFYRDAKVRAATDNGIWQRSLVDKYFKPIAQPMVLNIGKSNDKPNDNILFFDSYSIVNQENVKWHWTFKPQPISIDHNDIRNPKVTIDPDQTYDVSLTVTTMLNGKEVSDTKTVKSMIKGSKPVPENEEPDPNPIENIDIAKKTVEVFPTLISEGTPLKIVSKNVKDEMTMYIYDINGNVVRTLNVKNGDHVNVYDMQKGVHIYKIIGEDYTKVGRFLIQ